MGDYDMVQGVEDLIDAAIDCAVLHSPSMDGFLKQGGYYVFHSPSGGGSMILPGRGAPPPDLSDSNTTTDVLDPKTWNIDGETASELYARWEARIYELFHPYKTMPRPEDFDSAVEAFTPLLGKLAIQPELFSNSEGDGEPALDFTVTGNDEFTKVQSASAEFAVMQGLTADAFRKYYLDRFPLVTQRQYGVAQMLKAAVVGEQQVWKTLEEDVPKLISDATTAFRNGGQTGSVGKKDLEVAKVVTNIAGLIPALSVASSAAGTIFDLLGVLPEPKGGDPTYSLPGSGAEELWNSLVKASDKIKKTAAEQEQTLGKHMGDIGDVMARQPDKFDLGAIDDEYGPNDQSSDEELDAETDPSKIIGVVDINYDIVIGTGEDLKDVSHVFTDAAGLLDDGLESGTWLRSGEIGSDFIGHYQQTAELAKTLATILLSTSRALTDAGDVIQLVARRMRANDGDISGDLRRRHDAVERQGVRN